MSTVDEVDVELAPAVMEREAPANPPALPPQEMDPASFFCNGCFLLPAILGTLVLGTLLYIVCLLLLPLVALLVYLVVLLFFYMSYAFMPLHDWAEKVPVLLIKFFNAERSLWPTPRFADMADDDDVPDRGCAACCKRVTGEEYKLEPKRPLKKRATAWGIGAFVPVLTEAEYVNLRSLRLGISCFWGDIGAYLTDELLGLMGSMRKNTHLEVYR